MGVTGLRPHPRVQVRGTACVLPPRRTRRSAPPHVIGCQMAVRGSARRALFCLRRLPGADSMQQTRSWPQVRVPSWIRSNSSGPTPRQPATWSREWRPRLPLPVPLGECWCARSEDEGCGLVAVGQPGGPGWSVRECAPRRSRRAVAFRAYHPRWAQGRDRPLDCQNADWIHERRLRPVGCPKLHDASGGSPRLRHTRQVQFGSTLQECTLALISGARGRLGERRACLRV